MELEEAIRETNEMLEIRPAELFEMKRKRKSKKNIEEENNEKDRNPFFTLLCNPRG